MTRAFAPLVAAFLLAGCGLFDTDGPTVIDGSTPDAFDETLAEARSELGPRDRLKFEAAIRAVQAKQFAKADTRQEYEGRVRRALDGKTAPQIVAKVDADLNEAGNDAADTVFDIKREVKKLGGGGKGSDAGTTDAR